MRTAIFLLFLAMLAANAFCAAPVAQYSDSLVLQADMPALPCRISGIGKDGNILLRAAAFKGDVRIPVQKTVAITLKRSANEKGGDIVVLSNGDYLVGEVRGIADKSVTLAGSSIGTVKIPRSSVVQVRFGQKSSGHMLHTDFAHGYFAPWKPMSGTWSLNGGALTCSDERPQHIAAPLEQNGPLTYDLRLEIDPQSNKRPDVSLTLFADNTAPPPSTAGPLLPLGSNNITISLWGYRVYICQIANGKKTHFDVEIIPRDLWNTIKDKRLVHLRVAHRPRDGRLHIWINGELILKDKLSGTTKAGKLVLLACDRRQKIRMLSVMHGFHIPNTAVRVEGLTTQDTVALRPGATAAKGAMRPGNVRLTDGMVLIRTARGDRKYAVKDVDRITFREKDRHIPKPTAQDAVVTLHRSRITVVPAMMDATLLTGHNPILGNTKIKRAAIEHIMPSGPAASPGEPRTVTLKTGTVLNAVVRNIQSDGKVLIDGVGTVLATHVKRIDTTPSVKDTSPFVLVLTNSDRVAGNLLELNEDTVVVDSPATGEVDIPRALVRYIATTTTTDGTVSTDFADGTLGPWCVKAGQAAIKNGGLRITARYPTRQSRIVSLSTKQQGAMTGSVLWSRDLCKAHSRRNPRIGASKECHRTLLPLSKNCA